MLQSAEVCCCLTQPPTLLPLGEVSEAVGSTALGLLVLLDVPWQLGGDVGDKVAAGPQTVVVAPHPELTVLQRRRASEPSHLYLSNVAQMLNIQHKYNFSLLGPCTS